MRVSQGRVEALVIARAYTMRERASTTDLLAPLARFAPPQLTPAAWQEKLHDVVTSLRGLVLDDDNGLKDREELRRRIGTHHVTKWQQLSDRVLPALGLGVAADDSKTLAKLDSSDAWAAAIAGRARGQWRDGPPPSSAALCDAFAWERLGLTGKAKRLPGEVRSLFLQQELAATPARHDRLLRQLAARELGVPRADAKSLRDGLVRLWLVEGTLGPRAFTNDVVAVARRARDGVFGDRKVFIAEVWRALRTEPKWSSITLDDFKTRLLVAHRAGDLVLARADLVAAMNPEQVAASETTANGASFHFIVREAP